MPDAKAHPPDEGRYPGYDVLSKRSTPSWNEKTREVIIAHGLRSVREPRFFTAEEFQTVHAHRRVASCRNRRRARRSRWRRWLMRKLSRGKSDGYRLAGMPRDGEAWRRGLKALDAEAKQAFGALFRDLSAEDQDALLARMQNGASLRHQHGATCRRTPSSRCAWRATSSLPITRIRPRGARSAGADPQVRAAMSAWISTSATHGKPPKSRAVTIEFGTKEKPPCPMIPWIAPRAANGRAPDVFRPGAWVPMREYRDSEAVDFVIVGTGAGGGTLACKLAEHGFSVVAFDAGPYFRPLEDFASDESEQTKLYWTDDRIVDGDNPLQMGSNNSGKAVGGSTVHFAMVSLRFRPEWFKSRSLLGYGADWPLDWREMWDYYSRGRAGAENLRTGHLPLGAAASALSLSRS